MLEVRTKHTTYPIHFVHTADEVAADIVRVAPNGRLLIISDSHVAPNYLTPLVESLEKHSREVRTFVVPAGEASKSVEQAAALWAAIFEGDVDRHDTIIALGGGVVGDLSGFVASTIMRGIAFIQVPTSMLAMSDAAIGGKTGINVAAGKNLVGAFHQPLAVIEWIETLKTLSKRELASGMAEVIKSALLHNQEAVDLFMASATKAMAGDLEAAGTCARIGAQLKANIVSQDELEHGVRSYLNLGHTFAHAIEHARGYGDWTHGEAVAAGMVIAAQYSRDVGIATQELVDNVRALVQSVGLPDAPPALTQEEWIEPIFRDKKRVGNEVKLILLRGPGDVVTQLTPYDVLSTWVQENLSQP